MKEQKKQFKKPKILRGMFSSIIGITGAILAIAWLVIHHQIEDLVSTRTSEYVSSIAIIAANSSAEPLLSGDSIQLKLLAENVAKDPYLISATIFSEDGQIVAQHPEPNEAENYPDQVTTLDERSLSRTSDALSRDSNYTQPPQTRATPEKSNAIISDSEVNMIEADENTETDTQPIALNAQAFIQSQQNVPFIEKITYQGVTAGWFKVVLDQASLERDFRQSIETAQNIIMLITALLLVALLIILLRYERKVKRVIKACHRLIQLNAEPLPTNTFQWMESLNNITNTRIESNESVSSKTLSPLWCDGDIAEDITFCFCQFSIDQQEAKDAAQVLCETSQQIQIAANAFGCKMQGDILQGTLFPFEHITDPQEALSEALSLIYVIQSILGHRSIEIKVRSFIGHGAVLILKDANGLTAGAALSNRIQDKLAKIAPHAEYHASYLVNFDAEKIPSELTTHPIELPFELSDPNVLKIIDVGETIKMHSARQVSYISQQK